MATDTAVTHTATRSTGHTGTTDTATTPNICLASQVQGDVAFNDLTPLTDFALRGLVADVGDPTSLGQNTLASFARNGDLELRSSGAAIVKNSTVEYSFLKWVQAIPDASGDGQLDLLLTRGNELIAITGSGDELWTWSFPAACENGGPASPTNDVLVAPGLYGTGPDTDVLVGCPLNTGQNGVLHGQYDAKTPMEGTASGIYTLDGYFSGNAGAYGGTMAVYESANTWLGDQGDGYDPSKVFLLQHLNKGTQDIATRGDAIWVVNGDLTNPALPFHPQVLSQDFDHDGSEDLIVAINVDATNTPLATDPVQIAIFTGLAGRFSTSPTNARDANILLSAGTAYDRIVGPLRWLDQPGTNNDFLLVRVIQNGGNGAVVWVPTDLAAGTHDLATVQHGVLRGGSVWFGEWLPPIGDYDGDGCNDVVIQEGMPFPTQFGEGTAYVISGE